MIKNKYCPAGKIECDNYFEAAHGVFGCKAYRDDGHMLMFEFEDCPWKSKIKVPIKVCRICGGTNRDHIECIETMFEAASEAVKKLSEIFNKLDFHRGGL